ncbi:MAG: hypothetical protein WD794_17520 [Mycobacteriales bacterium]
MSAGPSVLGATRGVGAQEFGTENGYQGAGSVQAGGPARRPRPAAQPGDPG